MKPKFGQQFRVKWIDAFGDSQWTDEKELDKLIADFTKPADQTVNNLLINGKEENTRLKAADMVYKRLGGYAPDRTLNISVKGDIKEFEQFAELREKYEAELLNTFTHETTLGPVDNGMADSEPNKD